MEDAAVSQISRVHLNSAIFGRGNCDPAIESNCGGHDKAVVVIRMLANQVDATGRAIYAAGLAIQVAEILSQVSTAASVKCCRKFAHSCSEAALLIGSAWFCRL